MPKAPIAPVGSRLFVGRIAIARLGHALAIALTLTLALTSARAAGVPGERAKAAAPGASPGRPRLVVLVSIDQFRADYLERFRDLYLPVPAGGKPGGFRWLTEKGAYHLDARHDHIHLFTGPGHAVLLTGAPPYVSGIVGNSWWDRERKSVRYCVDDAGSSVIGSASARKGVSPRNLLVSTVGDELKMATGGRGRVWGIGFKDRAAMLMAGHLADGALWLDDESGRWISSSYYFKDGKLPAWVEAWNARKPMDAWFGKSWTPSAPASAYERAWTPRGAHADPAAGLGASFPHRIDGGLAAPGRAYYRAFTETSYANGYVFDSALEIVAKERLGQDGVPDILAISLSTNDYVGHSFGPDSPEVIDVSLQTDRQLAGFLQSLAAAVPGGMGSVTLVLSADHGVAPNAMAMKEAGFAAGVYDEDALRTTAEQALDRELGAADWTSEIVEGELYLDHATVDARKVPLERAQAIAASALAGAPGVYDAVTSARIQAGALPMTEISHRIATSWHPERSGDVVIIPAPFWTEKWAEKGATHGSPYAYDTRVPMVFAGAGIRAGRRTEPVTTLDIAPTLAALLGVIMPSGCEGRVLGDDLDHVAQEHHGQKW
jgi:predicted AlkP superfamily pyrophosphatase or phosphodiesterase